MADVTLPQLGETVTEGTITQWFKQVGDSVAADEPLFEVSTDKVDTEVPSPVAGTLTEIRVQEGETVAVGTVIAVVGDGDGAAPAEAPAAGRQPPSEAPAPSAEPSRRAGGAAAGGRARPRPTRRSRARSRRPSRRRPPRRSPHPRRAGAAAEPGRRGAGRRRRRRAALLSPVVRRLVTEHGLDPADDHRHRAGRADHPRRRARPHRRAPARKPQPATGRAADGAAGRAAAGGHGRRRTGAGRARRPAAGARPSRRASGTRTVKLSRIRKLTGAHMVMSKGVSPHAFSVVEVDYANVDRARGAVKDEWKQDEGFSLTYLPFISRAVIDALAEFPHLNASVGEDELVVHRFVDLGIAVDLDYEGLIVPGHPRRRQQAAAGDRPGDPRPRRPGPDQEADARRDQRRHVHDHQQRLGRLGADDADHQPAAGGDPVDRRRSCASRSSWPSADGGEAIVIHPVGNLAMAWDHRAFDGAYAAGFLRADQGDPRDQGLVRRAVS